VLKCSLLSLLLLILVHLIDVLKDHQAEGQGVEHVQELILLEVVISWQLQRGDEFVLQEARFAEGVVEA
jgi:hypothetical protein